MHTQQPPDGQVSAVRVESKGEGMVRVKFKEATRHPDYGEIDAGEVLEVSAEYADAYRALKFAEESTERLSRRTIKPDGE